MKKPLLLFSLLTAALYSVAQVQYTPGPELDNDRDAKLNRMIGGDENSFFTYRIRTKGRGTSFIIEKYDSKKLQPQFSKEINMEGDEKSPKIENILYCKGTIYVFRRNYDKQADQMTLTYQTISGDGAMSTKQVPLTSANSDHYEFVDYDIYQNPSKTKFLVKCSHKPNREGDFTTDFMAFDPAAGMKKLWTKTTAQQLTSGTQSTYFRFMNFGGRTKKDMSLVGLEYDDQDNVYYCFTEEAEGSGREKHYQLFLGTLPAADEKPRRVELHFDDEYSINDIAFSRGPANELVVAGYVKDVIERRGRDLVKVGFFSYKVDLASNTVSAKAITFFDDQMLKALESSPRRSRYFKYKLDYIFNIGSDVYYVGEQYNEEIVTRSSSTGLTTSTYFNYEYMDVIVTKMNASGKFEWIKNVPLRNEVKLPYGHVFKQYIAVPTDKSLYILCDDHPKNIERYEKENYEPSDLKTVSGIHGSNFVANQVDLAKGTIKRSVVFENEKYCFAPIQERDFNFLPPSSWEIFVPIKKNEIIIYTEDRGRDQFGRIVFK
jgi:hypothetical protein